MATYSKLLDTFQKYIKEKQLIDNETTTLIALSGGVDSIALIHLFTQSNYPFAIAHANFMLRPESNGEELAIKQIATQYKVTCHTIQYATQQEAQKNKESIQLTARKLRYSWFLKLKEQHGYGQIATAHHADDQIETILYNLIKGGGIAGFKGIMPKRTPFIRPLLSCSKQEIVQYAQANNLKWYEDQSNQKIKYRRNYIRKEIVPKLKAINPNLTTTITETSTRMQDLLKLIETTEQDLKKNAYQQTTAGTQIYTPILRQTPGGLHILLQWLQPFQFFYRQIHNWWVYPPQKGKKIENKKYQITAEGDHWFIGKHSPSSERTYLITQTNSFIKTDCFTYKSSEEGSILSYETDPYTAQIDLEKIKFPLTLRLWRPGDHFQPLGMQGRKKVSKYLTDLKISCSKKKKCYILSEANGEIIWIVGFQISHPYRITHSTQRILHLEYIPIKKTR